MKRIRATLFMLLLASLSFLAIFITVVLGMISAMAMAMLAEYSLMLFILVCMILIFGICYLFIDEEGNLK